MAEKQINLTINFITGFGLLVSHIKTIFAALNCAAGEGHYQQVNTKC